jgi:tripartite ATP-independent transporter DctM subunit
MILVLFALLFLFFGLGFSIWIAMGLSGAIYILLQGQVSLNAIGSYLVQGVDSPTLVAIPFFIFAGELMNKTGITRKLADFASYFVGGFRGGMAYVAIVVNFIMAGVSGSAVADATAVSSVLLPTMEKQGYPKPFAASINAAAAVVGPIIPPSIPMIFIGVISGLSIGKLFLAGIVPGLLVALALAGSVFVVSRRGNYPVVKVERSMREFLALLKDTLFALLTPVIIVLGVVLGVVTLVEVAALAVFYILVVSLVVYRSITLREIFSVAKSAAVFSTAIMIIFAVVGVFQYIVVQEQFGEKLHAIAVSLDLSQVGFLIAVNLFYLFMGCIIDAIPVMLIFFPVLLPVAVGLGVDPTHFGLITVLNLMIGLLTPPVGALLFIETKIAKVPFGTLVRASLPYTLVLFAVLLLCTFTPGLVMFIPNLVFGG